jgi:hypothetical protein
MKLSYFIPLLFLSACSTPKRLALTVRPQEPPPVLECEDVRYPEWLRAYHVGRYADPNNARIMHEHHTVYRLEANSRWNLHPGLDCSVNLESSTTPTNAAFSQPALNDAALAELNLQKAATAQVINQAKVLTASLDQLQAAIRQARMGIEETAAARAAVVALERRLQAMEAEQRRLSQSVVMPPVNAGETNLLSSPLTDK